MVFGAWSSASNQAAVLAEDKHVLTLTHSLGESTALYLYHNFVNFGGCRTHPAAKMVVMEGLGPLTTLFHLPEWALD